MSLPILIDLVKVPVLVVGAGAVATRRCKTILEAGGRPVIVAPRARVEMQALVRRHGLEWRQRNFEDADASGFRLVFAATDSRGANARAAAAGRAAGALVNVADEPATADFHLPATARRGDLVVAVGTGGSPLLARRLRDKVAELLTPGLEGAAARLAGVRGVVHRQWPDQPERRRAFWFRLITPEFLDAAIAGREEDVELSITRCLSQS